VVTMSPQTASRHDGNDRSNYCLGSRNGPMSFSSLTTPVRIGTATFWSQRATKVESPFTIAMLFLKSRPLCLNLKRRS